MATFPTLTRSMALNYEEESYKPFIRSSFDGNYSQVRPKFTRTVKTFKITFNAITVSDKNTLNTFFDTNIGLDFTWTNPADSLPYLVRFKDDTILFKHIANNLYTVTLTLEEV